MYWSCCRMSLIRDLRCCMLMMRLQESVESYDDGYLLFPGASLGKVGMTNGIT